MRERMFALTTPEEVNAFVADHPICVIFKAGTCHKTMQGWGNIESFLSERPDVPVGVIRVVESRPASNHVAAMTGIVHQSPQIILFCDQKAKFDLDNWNITKENLGPEFKKHLPPLEGSAVAAQKTTSLDPYKNLMDKYLAGDISEQQFQWAYLEMFRNDANLRSEQEFALLDSLFGNPDEHHIHAGAVIQLEMHNQAQGVVAPLLERVQALRAQIA
ncbi:MAG: monothiol bacilliredoxin BrxC family protein [Deinococcales bacterium]